jgi:hypothetical protein
VRKALRPAGSHFHLLYAVANDLLAAILHKAYSPFSHAVSRPGKDRWTIRRADPSRSWSTGEPEERRQPVAVRSPPLWP